MRSRRSCTQDSPVPGVVRLIRIEDVMNTVLINTVNPRISKSTGTGWR